MQAVTNHKDHLAFHAVFFSKKFQHLENICRFVKIFQGEFIAQLLSFDMNQLILKNRLRNPLFLVQRLGYLPIGTHQLKLLTNSLMFVEIPQVSLGLLIIIFRLLRDPQRFLGILKVPLDFL